MLRLLCPLLRGQKGSRRERRTRGPDGPMINVGEPDVRSLCLAGSKGGQSLVGGDRGANGAAMLHGGIGHTDDGAYAPSRVCLGTREKMATWDNSSTISESNVVSRRG